jgi:DNA-binding NarL/FixJ family response regulator
VTLLRVAIADDHALVRAGLRSILESFPDVNVVAEAADGREAVRIARERRPDVLLMDFSMPGMNGIEATLRIATGCPRTRVLVLSMHANEEYVREALHAGAAGYLVKNAERIELEMAVRAVARGETWLSPSVAGAIARAFAEQKDRGRPDSPFQLLSPRQREILQLIAEGRSTKTIASELELSVKTVETHRARLMERLAIRVVAGLTRYAVRVGLVAGGA